MVDIEEMKAVVGNNSILTDDSVLDSYSHDLSFANKIRPDCVVKVKNSVEIKELVRLANLSSTALVPVSSGGPHFHGDTVPSTGGAIVVDLSGMKNIVRIDRRNRMVLIEPGVTYGELIPALASEGMRFALPLLPRNSKSVVGSMLEREPTTMPGYHWDISDPLGCVEIVFGTGKDFRTGAAAGPGSIAEQWEAGGAQQEAAGPTQFSLYRVIQGAQGTLGIVTWASAKTELLPTVERPFLVGSSDLEKLIDTVHWLVRLRLVNECFIVNSANLALIASADRSEYQRAKQALPPWILFFNIAGYEYFPEERVDACTSDMLEVARKNGVQPLPALGSVSAERLLTLVQHPSSEPYWKLRPHGSCEDVMALALYDRVPSLVTCMNDLASHADYPVSDMGVYLQPIVQNASCHVEFNLFYDHGDNAQAQKTKELSLKATRALMAKGAFFSRPYAPNVDTIFDAHGGTVRELRRVKSIFDPNNVMNPGKLCF